MSVHGMKPSFTDFAGYQAWRSDWRELYAHASEEIRKSKYAIKNLQRWFTTSPKNQDETREQLKSMIAEHRHRRIIARKLMTVLEEAKIRWQNIRNMQKGIEEQNKEFPLSFEARNIDFHFNKKSLEFDFIPTWVVKARGKSFYVNHMDCQAPWTTRETPDHPSTKGSLRIKKGTLSINKDGIATII